ncbi:aldehyde dehydrogenase family protein [Kocuria palustris]|uniref:aldehyde dehydrogenase family protein n=1 Tax=Kocuria palustris TaxID=71999 RepID=UPI0021B32EF8|nr:aldehyde dehydrogenase family protein [Kocuria palustris]
MSDVEGLDETAARGIDRAVERAQDAFRAPVDLDTRLDRLDRLERALQRHREPLQAALAQDLGKSATEAEVTEIGVSLTELRHVRRNVGRWMAPRSVGSAAVLAPSTAWVEPQPLGTALIIAPWNYPVQLVFSPLVGALAAGCTAVVKPSEVTPHVAQALADALQELSDCVSVVLGAIPETTRLLQHRFDHIFFTGNSTVGRVVMRAAAEHLTPVTLELGGKSPVWIDDTVDLPAAARRLAWAKLVNAGQTCVAPDYVMGPSAVLAQLEQLLPEAVRSFYGTDPQRSESYGRIVTPRHLSRLTELLERIPAEDIVAGGRHDADDRYLEPTIIRSASDGPAMEEEIFGPILPLVAVEDHREAARFVADGEKPLALYVFSEREEVREGFRGMTSSGGMTFEAPMVHLIHPQLPFGGVGDSGTGSYHGQASFETFSHLRSVLDKPLSPETLQVTFPPYTGVRARAAQALMAAPTPGELVHRARRRLRRD